MMLADIFFIIFITVIRLTLHWRCGIGGFLWCKNIFLFIFIEMPNNSSSRLNHLDLLSHSKIILLVVVIWIHWSCLERENRLLFRFWSSLRMRHIIIFIFLFMISLLADPIFRVSFQWDNRNRIEIYVFLLDCPEIKCGVRNDKNEWKCCKYNRHDLFICR